MAPPVIVVSVPATPMRLGTGVFAPDDPTFGPAWKRDETMTVKVTTNEPIVGAVTLFSAGPLRDGGTSGFGNPGVMAVSATKCCGVTTNCSCFDVDLQGPVFEAFNGQVKLQAYATDLANNPGSSAIANIPTTRWRWSLQAFQVNDTPQAPAVDPLGNVVAGAGNGNNGTLVSIDPIGTLNWRLDAGAVTAAVAIGAPDAGSLVYVPVRTAAGAQVLTVRSSNGTPVPGLCGLEAGKSIVAAITVARVSVGSLTSEQASVIAEDGTGGVLLGYRPLDANNGCITGSASANRVAGAESAMTSLANQNVVFNTTGSYWVANAGNLTSSNQFPTSAGMAARTIIPGLSITGAVSGGLFYGMSQSYPNGFTGLGTFGQPALGTSNTAFVGASTNQLHRFSLNTSVGTTRATSGTVVSTPLLGAGGVVYAVTHSGVLHAFDAASLEPLWSRAWGMEAFLESPTLDCARGIAGSIVAGPGTLYAVGDDTGRVYSVIVDSHGLDTLAPWPKFQRGPRNHGDNGSPILDVGCP